MTKSLWNKHHPMKMSDFSKLACLAIKYVQDLDLDYSVGYDSKTLPQVWHVPTIPKTQFDAISSDGASVKLQHNQ